MNFTFKDIIKALPELGSLELSQLDFRIRMEFKKRFNIDTIVLIKKEEIQRTERGLKEWKRR